MKLFDLTNNEKRSVKRFLAWHFGYIAYVFSFSLFIYHFGLFKAYWFLEEYWLLNMVSPLHTIAFILISPYRKDWGLAIKNMYIALDKDPAFCIMAFLVFGVGFYLYNGLLWGMGSLVPSIFFT